MDASSGHKQTITREYLPGTFGWAQYGSQYVPYIYRQSEKYVAIRMLYSHTTFVRSRNFMHPDIFSACDHMARLPITDFEVDLLNEINRDHCNGKFGSSFFDLSDTVIPISDAYEFYQFIGFCFNKLTRGSKFYSRRCSFISINKQCFVPYIVRNDQKLVPDFFFAGDTDILRTHEEPITGWDLSYLMFCCSLLGIRREFYSCSYLNAILLDDVESAYPNGTEFEECWAKDVKTADLYSDFPLYFLKK
ncbi:uncharacterized protein LOC119558376 [Drosophila subpulchrella]|uniref:uncharacterized protein LOC119558376 n=1 Tax=Drosophila subpulchrella TaxID=1486046 RepID=UPI0018A1563E|nr:uncharacterized protein LOC119558376 [Drosophila subpulchrella]